MRGAAMVARGSVVFGRRLGSAAVRLRGIVPRLCCRPCRRPCREHFHTRQCTGVGCVEDRRVAGVSVEGELLLLRENAGAAQGAEELCQVVSVGGREPDLLLPILAGQLEHAVATGGNCAFLHDGQFLHLHALQLDLRHDFLGLRLEVYLALWSRTHAEDVVPDHDEAAHGRATGSRLSTVSRGRAPSPRRAARPFPTHSGVQVVRSAPNA